MKNLRCLFLLAAVFWSISCTGSLSPTKEPDFSQLQFYANIGRGWGSGYELRVYRSGWALVRNWPRMEGEWDDAEEVKMKSSEMEVMRDMERNFHRYRRSYPHIFVDSQEFTVVLAGTPPDTTHFCCPGHDKAEVPETRQEAAGAFNAIADRGLE